MILDLSCRLHNRKALGENQLGKVENFHHNVMDVLHTEQEV